MTHRRDKYGGDILNPRTWDEMSKMVKEGPVKPSLDDLVRMAGLNPCAEIELGPSVICTEQDLKEDLQKCNQSFKAIQAKKQVLEQAFEFISNLPFRAGDAAFHRVFGNVLVQGVLLNSGDHENSSYCILLTSGKRGQAPLNELLPISEATKVLYSKG